MARRPVVRLEEVADLANLAAAFWRAAAGKRLDPEVQRFARQPDRELEAMRRQILDLTIPVGSMRVFRIYDPKPRTIHAPCFRERVLHHALMAHVGPVLERSLVDDTFACRPGKGALAAVLRAQRQARRFRAFAKLDVRSYFASIDHEVLRAQLRRRIRGRRTLQLLDRILDSHCSEPGRGLPIGALTSQHLANLYLADLDRFILEERKLGLVRYMDDAVLWGRDRQEVREVAGAAESFASSKLRVRLSKPWQVMPTSRGVPLCGFRVFGDRLLLSRRRKRRYRRARRHWEAAYTLGLLDGRALQAGYASARAITAHAGASAFRRNDLDRRPAPDV